MPEPQDALPPTYSPREVEDKWYPVWVEKGYFTPEIDPGKKPYTIVIPPPNVTGILHMGHALNNSVQDILIRWRRMTGLPTLWVPGTDHAGIATQNVVEKKLAKQGKSRFDLGREQFVKEVWNWKEEYGSTIIKQLKRLGSSCDWKHERFTMDEGLSRAVREAFVRLYENDLIYQGHYIINWCPRCQTALSDEEAPYSEVDGKLYYYHYWIKDPKTGEMTKDDKVVVATTRPETMLGDTAIAVNPKDKRYRDIDKKQVILPLQNRQIKVIKDDVIDPEFGTGVVKVTPAHDPNDFEMGHRHHLEFRNVLHPDGKVNDKGAPYADLDRFEARKRIIEDLKKEGLFVKEEAHRHKVPHCYRCHTVVEPYLSKQWFVRMKPLAEKAIAAQKAKKIKFYPVRWTKVYLHWLKNIRDWCISRQIWWGHQIPVWYCDACIKEGGKGIIVSRQDPAKCPECGHSELRRDPDVLDTWFSSWLWPFSTLGWPEKTKDLEYFYPTTSLCTAQEILFFWVARMIMAGLQFMGEVPFTEVYIHGTVRTDTGQKMSKSLGNAIDPLELITEIGADALRFSIIMLTASGQDAYLSKEKFDIGRNFTNKIWNAARFSFMNLKDFRAGKLSVGAKDSEINRWIVSANQNLITEVDKALKAYRFNDAANAIYRFFWHDFCDWYLELIKPVMFGTDEAEKEKTLTVLVHVLETTLRLLHPIMPFVTEEIWQALKKNLKEGGKMAESIMIAPWPKADKMKISKESENKVDFLRQAVVGIRDLRANLGLKPGDALPQAGIIIKSKEAADFIETFSDVVQRFCRVEKIKVGSDEMKDTNSISRVYAGIEICVWPPEGFDRNAEKEKTRKKIAETAQFIESLTKRLSNEDFVRKAPEEVVEKEKARLEELKSLHLNLESNLALFDKA